MNLIYSAIVGIMAGWLAGQIMKGRGFGLVGNLVVGVVGAVLGGWLFAALGLTAYGTVGSIIMAVAGACVLLFAVGLLKRA
ncbi:MAG: GlsB/YeaQ/YmgE family stress response membrane protein [Vicinamibacteria bacterium]